MKNLNQIIENHFIVPLEDYLKSLMPEQQQYSNTSSIYIYNNTGIGNMNGGEIKAGAKVAGVINETEQKNLAKTAAEIQQLLEQLSQNYPTNTTTEQMVVATKAIEQIESNPDLKQKVINAAKEGGLAAFEKALDNPIGAFSIGAIKGWLEAKAE